MKKDFILTLKHFLIISIPFSIISIIFFTLDSYRVEKYSLNSLAKEELISNKAIANITSQYMSEAKEGMFVIRDSNEINDYIFNKNDETLTELQNMFIRLIGNKSYYDQIRFINNNGMEVVRVNNINNVPQLSKKLQFKGNRDYFQDSLILKEHEIYVSPMDLNIENNSIELPYKPMLRFTTPVFLNNNFEGIIVVNYKASHFLNLLDVYSVLSTKYNIKTYLCNKNGGFIVNPDENLNFSFMFDNFKNESIFNAYPNVISDIYNKNSGIYYKNNLVVIFSDLLQYSHNMFTVNSDRWMLIHVIDKSEALNITKLIKHLVKPLYVFIFLIIQILIFLSIILYRKLKVSDRELKIAKKISESISDAVVITDKDTVITHVNKAYELQTGYSSAEVIGHKPNEFKSGLHDDTFYKNMWNKITTEGVWEGSLWDISRDGALIPKKLKILSINESKGKKTTQYLGIFNRINSDKFKDDSKIIEDFKVENEDMLGQLLDKNITVKWVNFMVISLVIENYNELLSINKTYNSHTISRLFINIIKTLINRDDIVAQTSRNIFSIIINTSNLSIPHEEFISNFFYQINRVIKKDDEELFLKIKMGVSLWPQDADDVRKLLLNSVLSLEWAINRQERDYAFYSPSMLETISYENKIERLLKRAMELDELYMVYQPQVDSEKNRCVGVEALIRWDSSEMGSIPPDNFISIAERSSIIIDIGYWIINQVCMDIVKLKKLNLIPEEGFRVAINVSAKQLEDFDFTKHAFKIIDSYNIDYNLLELEITESLLMKHQNSNKKKLDYIRSKGISISLDDFGTGYSSLSYLHQLPINKMKIDRSFIKDYPEKDDGRMLKILAEMSRVLNITVLTEGVETESQMSYLKEVGCNLIQGYFFSKPLNFVNLAKFLTSFNENK